MATNHRRYFFVSVIVFCVELISHIRAGSDDAHWRYFGIYGVTNWSRISADCDSVSHHRQSPVHIVTEETSYDCSLKQISLTVRHAPHDLVTMVNNGHTVDFQYNKSIIQVVGGGLNGTYRVAGVHFHWGSKNSLGSEHTINGKHYPLEMHIVTYDATRYSGVIEASHGSNSIAVLGVLFELSDDDNYEMDHVVSHLISVQTAGHPQEIPYVDLRTLLPSNTSTYYRYMGSLTTPPCSEAVIWSVFHDTPKISARQMDEFRKLQEMVEDDGTIDYLIDNWRPPQPLYERRVQRSFTDGNSGAKNMPQIVLVILAVTGLLLKLLA